MNTATRMNILNGDKTIIIFGNYSSYVFETVSLDKSCSSTKNFCQGCKRVNWCRKTFFGEKLCIQCFTRECCTICKRWCGSTLCEDCEDCEDF